MALIGIGRPCVPSLIEALHDANGKVRTSFLQDLQFIGDARAIPALLSIARNGEEAARVRDWAVEALWNVPSAQAAMDCLLDRRCGFGAGTLGFSRPARAVPVLIEALTAGFGSDRVDAAVALGRIGDRRAVPALVQALKDTNSDLRSAAADALGELEDGRAVDALMKVECRADENLGRRIGNALVKIGRPAVPALIKTLTNVDGNLLDRADAASLLGRIRSASAVPALIETLRDAGPTTWALAWAAPRMAARALVMIGDPAAVPALIDALKDQHPRARINAAEALGAFGDARALPSLKEALDDGDFGVRSAAARAIRSITTNRPH